MPVRKRKPTSPGRRFQTVSDFAEITRDKPEKSLTKPKPRTLTVEKAVRMLLKSRQPVLAFSEPDGGGMRIAYRLEDGQVGLLELD